MNYLLMIALSMQPQPQPKCSVCARAVHVGAPYTCFAEPAGVRRGPDIGMEQRSGGSYFRVQCEIEPLRTEPLRTIQFDFSKERGSTIQCDKDG